LDFESDEEFTSFFGRYRIILFEVIKLISAISPIVPYQFTDVWLRSVLSSPPNFGKGKAVCSNDSPTYLELDAIQLILDAILAKLSGQEELQPVLGPAIDLLKLCLDYRTTDPYLISVLLSCISSLFVVVTVTPAALMPVLNRIFEAITFGSQRHAGNVNGGSVQPPNMPNDVKLLRRHGCCLLVKIGYRYPKTLVPVFDHMRSTIVEEFQFGGLHKMEYVTLVEALVLISNEFANYNAQSAFLKTLAEPICHELRSLLPTISNSERLMRHIGLIPDSDLDTCQKNRSNLAFCLQFLLAISRRTLCPTSDITKCRQGGFVYTAAGLEGQQNVLALQNPAGQVAVAVLEAILTYAKTLNELWSPASMSLMSAEFVKALDLLDVEKKTLIGISLAQRSSSVGPKEDENGDDGANKFEAPTGGSSQQPPAKSEVQRLQGFIFEQFENVYHFLSQCFISYGHEIYRQPNLSEAISSTVLQGFPHIPDYRLRAVVRTFLKSLINKCPQRYFSSVIAPLLHQLMPYMLRRLSEKWNQVKYKHHFAPF
jgi:exportin-5